MKFERKTSVLLPALLFVQLLSPALLTVGAASAEYIMLAPNRLYLGTESSVSISSLSSETGKPIDRRIELSLVEIGKSGNGILIYEGRTGPDGHLIARFGVPDVEKGGYQLVLSSPGTSEEVSGDITVADSVTLLIETDKPIYKPGQTIYGRVLALNTELRPVEVSLNVSISDAKGTKIFREGLTTSEFGVAPFELVLADELNLGTWKITANAKSGMSTVDIRVEEYVLPKFEVEVITARDWFLVDEEITGEIEANYFFGKPVDGIVEVRAFKYLADWEEFATFRGQLEDGSVRFDLPQANYLAGTLGSGGLGSVMLNVTVIDGAGHEERDSKLLKIAASPTVIQVIPSSETVKPGLPLDILIVTETPGGDPLDKSVRVEVTYSLEDGNSRTETETANTFSGLAAVDLNVPKSCTQAEIRARVIGEESEVTLELRSVYSPGGYFIHIKQASPGEVNVGDPLVFEVLSTSRRTVYYDVVTGGRTLYSGYSTQGRISFTVTPDMVPGARLVAYVINSNMEVSADSIPFDVEIGNPVGLSAQFSSQTSAPGDTVVVDLQSSAGIATMIGISIVDESVYALNEGRLNLRQIFNELEKIFMEPQAEAHPEGEMRLWAPLGVGAADIFEEAGVQVITSKQLEVPSAGYSFWDDFGRGGGMVLEDAAAGKNQATATPPSAQTHAEQGELAEVERIRQFFPETWYWNPTLATDSSGHASVELTVPDTITTWKLHAVSSSTAGIGMAEASLKVFQDFFVEPDLPYAVTRGEEFPVLIQVYNYLDTSQTVQLEITEDDWFELVDEQVKIGTVPGNSVASIAFTIKPSKIGQFKIEITARTTERADAVRKSILVEAEGTPRELVQNGFITEGEPRTYNLTLPDGIVEDSGRVLLSITPSLVGQTISGMEDLLGMPYGCGEQNMMFMAPDLEILRYLDATDQVVPEIRAKAEMFLTTGYQRELTFRRNDGSFSAFGQSDDEGSLWLTAFVLDVFSESREVMAIDEVVLAEAASWIESHQNADGSWDPVGFVVHKEMLGGMTGDSKTALTAFVAIALADYASAQGPLGSAVTYLEENALGEKDAYAMALASYLLEKIGSPRAGEAINSLLDLAQTDENGMYWSPGGERSNAIEATSYAVLALMLEGRSEAEQGIRWLASQRNSFGGFSSTQDTVMAMKALMMAARLQARNIDSQVIVELDGTEFTRIQLTESNFDVLQVVELPGNAVELGLSMVGKGNVMFQVVKKFNIPGEVYVNPEFDLEVEYNTTSAQVNDIVEVTATVQYNGFYNSTGMLILDIAVPTGFLPVQSTLDEIVSSGLATRVEVAGRKVIFYIDDLERGDELEISFSILALFPVKARGGTSTAYSYYKPEVKAEAPGNDFDVQGEIPSRFGPAAEGPDDGGDGGNGGEGETLAPPSPLFPFVLIAILLAGISLAVSGRARGR